jgi:hypothetical protein
MVTYNIYCYNIQDDCSRLLSRTELRIRASAFTGAGPNKFLLSEGLISSVVLALWRVWEAKTNKTAKFESRRRRNPARTSSRWRRLRAGEPLPSRGFYFECLPIRGAPCDNRVSAELPLQRLALRPPFLFLFSESRFPREEDSSTTGPPRRAGARKGHRYKIRTHRCPSAISASGADVS